MTTVVLQTVTRFRYVEEDGLTFRKKNASEEADKRNYVLNFTLKIRAEVKGSEEEPEGGYFVDLAFNQRGSL